MPQGYGEPSVIVLASYRPKRHRRTHIALLPVSSTQMMKCMRFRCSFFHRRAGTERSGRMRRSTSVAEMIGPLLVRCIAVVTEIKKKHMAISTDRRS